MPSERITTDTEARRNLESDVKPKPPPPQVEISWETIR